MVGIFPTPKEIYSPMIKVGKLILVLLVCIGCKTTKPVPYTTHPMIIKDTITVYIEHIHLNDEIVKNNNIFTPVNKDRSDGIVIQKTN